MNGATTILEALERLAAKTGIEVPRPTLRRAVERATEGAGDLPWEEIARRAGREVGLDVRAVRNEASTLVTATPSTGLDPLRSPNGEHATPARRLLALARLERDDIAVAVVYAAALGVLSLATPFGVQMLVNTVAFGALVQPIVVLTILVSVGLVFAATLRALQAWVVERAQQRIFVRTALDFAGRLPHVAREAFESDHGPQIVNRFFDVVTVQKGVASLLVDATALLLQSAVGLLVLGLYHPYLLGLAVLLAVLVGGVVVVGRGGTATAIDESQAKYALAAWLEEVARHPNVFRSEAGSARAGAHAEDLTRAWLTERRRHFDVVFRQIGAALAAQVIGSAALLGVGGWLVVAKQLSLGQLVAAELIVTAVLAAVSKLGKYFEAYYDLLAALDKIGHVVDLPRERRGGARPTDDRGLELVDVDGLSLRAEPGTRIAILDPDERAGRALVDTLGGFAAPTSGLVTLGGVDVREADLEHLRTACAVVRGPEVFAGTIRENVAIGRLDADVEGALRAASAWDEVTALPGGLETHVTTDGAPLSPSLALRITIARALAGRPRALVLDGALDALAPGEREALVDGASQAIIVTTRDPAVALRFPLRLAAEDGRLVRT